MLQSESPDSTRLGVISGEFFHAVFSSVFFLWNCTYVKRLNLRVYLVTDRDTNGRKKHLIVLVDLNDPSCFFFY